MLALIDAVGAERAVVLGHSLGGYLSLRAGARPPRPGPRRSCSSTPGPGYRNDAARDGWNDMATALRRRPRRPSGLDGLPGGDELSPSVHSSATGLALAARQVLTQHDSHVIDGLPTIDVPTLVVVGEHDEPFLKGSHYMAEQDPERNARGDRRRRPRPARQPPRAFNTVLRTYLERLDP